KTQFLLVALALAGCAKPTPVAPAPLSAGEEPKLRAALAGSCQVTKTQSQGGEPKEAKGIHFTFKQDRKLLYRGETPISTLNKEYKWELDGRNIKSDGLYKTMRVDDYSGGTLKLFIYDTSDTFYCSHE